MPTQIEISLPRGKCPLQVFGDAKSKSAPVVLFFMDAFGPRPVLSEIAERFAKEGYTVVLPHLFYQHLPFEPLNPSHLFSGGPDRDRLMKMFLALTQSQIDEDVKGLLAHIANTHGSVPIACVGYCMGGRYALTAATMSPQVVFAGSFHGGALALDSPDSPHNRVAGIKSRIYVGVAGVDPMYQGAEAGRLAVALRDGNVDHIVETYQGLGHGWVMKDLPVYNAAGAERHFQRAAGNMKEMFAARA